MLHVFSFWSFSVRDGQPFSGKYVHVNTNCANRRVVFLCLWYMSLGKQGYVFLSYAFDQILWYLAHIFASFKKVPTQPLISYLYLSGAQSTLFFANGCTIYCLNGSLIMIVYIESQAELHGLSVSINYCSKMATATHFYYSVAEQSLLCGLQAMQMSRTTHRASSWWRWWYTRGRRGDDPTRGARISCVSPWWTEWQLRLWRSMGRMKNDDTGDHLGGGSADFWLVTTWNRKLLVGSSWWNRPTQWEWRTRQLHVPDQFLRCAHRGRVCVRVFIWMSVHAYLWAFAFVLCLKKNRKLWNAFRQPWYRHTVCNKIV